MTEGYDQALQRGRGARAPAQRDGKQRESRRHDGQRITCLCSDGLEIAWDNGEKVRVGFALDCCDREAMGHIATTGGITAKDVQDLMLVTVEHRSSRSAMVPVWSVRRTSIERMRRIAKWIV